MQDYGGEVTIADSPGGPFREGRLKRVYQKTGMKAVAEATGARLSYSLGSYKLNLEEGKVAQSFEVADFLQDVDLLVNMPKLKSHPLTGLTIGVKNLFGVIPGLDKIDYHLKLQEREFFSEFLIDLALAVAPGLNILDGILSMDGDGPSSGRARKTGLLLLARDPFLLDLAAGRLVGLKEEEVLTNRRLLERGLAPAWEELKADLPEKILQGDEFEIPSPAKMSAVVDNLLPLGLGKRLLKYLRPRPKFLKESCIGCGDCELNCPPEALKLDEDEIPELELEKCIRCFCCQELCPQEAVEIYRPLPGRLIFRS